uniref:Beta-1,3-glucanase n=1 Tax=Drosera adelae TaxID=173387 RepID=A0A1L7NZS7_9CARY|nr:beta-1,3-glucanase [Drosera adelae]
MAITLFVLGLLLSSLNPTAAIGTCFGQVANNLPSPSQVVSQYKQYNIQAMRIYGPDSQLSQALQGSGIQLMVGVPNGNLQSIASSQGNANSWVQNNILPYPNVQFKYIAVGNEIRPNNGASQYAQYVLPAMQNIWNAVKQYGLSNNIKVSTPWEMGVVTNTYPPSSGEFDPSIQSYTQPIIRFLVDNGLPLFLNCYPYFSYKDNTADININYALFTSPGTVVQDGQYGYQNLLFAMLDSVNWALEKAGAGGVTIILTETGWPTAGDVGTSIANAQTYNNNLIQKVKQGTPKRPGQAIQTYIFDMYNEDLKSPAREQNWGLFYNTGAPKYPVTFN